MERTWEFDGGAVMNQASHYVDLLQWLGGPIQSVQAISSTSEQEHRSGEQLYREHSVEEWSDPVAWPSA